MVLSLLTAGCHGVKASADNATAQRGLRFDENGKVTSDPEVSVPVWSSKGLKEKPTDVAPTKR